MPLELIKPLKLCTPEQVQSALQSQGYPAYRGKQILQWVYQKGVSSYDEMTNLSKAMRADLAASMPLHKATIVEKRISKDGTRKYVVEFYDGSQAEMVAIPAPDRLTVCFSTQIGCPMGCVFCATGNEGFGRNLGPGEIVDQVVLAQEDMGMRVSNLVGMGQGEPFLNFENTISAMRIMNSKDGLGIAARKMAVSTCGIIDGIQRLAVQPEQFTLAVSLHSAIQETRDRLMPKMITTTLGTLRQAIQSYCAQTHRRVTFEYMLAEGVNTDNRHLDALVGYCKGLLCHVNLITLNSVEGSDLKPTTKRRTQVFLETLESEGIEASIRESRGSDIQGACGQLKHARNSDRG
ncbi:MAG: 23S rRNA (adenine(2503)-C(2))-methyltransferase RlmN [Eggerthellales bacterium]|nr:23S rRNA (adenine(2503)-C(2))-methyltransferase RlmN [Eggerthellales bacterium]